MAKIMSNEKMQVEIVDTDKLDQGKYQAGVIQDFMPAINACVTFGCSTSSSYDEDMFFIAFEHYQLRGMYNVDMNSNCLVLVAMAYYLICYLEVRITGEFQEPIFVGAIRHALKEVAELGSMNNKPFGKYERGSWKKVQNAKERYLDAFWRHQLEGPFNADPTTGKIHVVAMLWNLLALIMFEIEGAI